MARDLFDDFGSTEKTLYVNMGGHTGVPQLTGEDAARFFARHLGSVVGCGRDRIDGTTGRALPRTPRWRLRNATGS